MTSKWVREYLPSLPVHNVSEEARERAAFVAAEREYRLRAENARLRLTDEEREAVEQAIDAASGMAQAEPWAAATLRKMLERLA